MGSSSFYPVYSNNSNVPTADSKALKKSYADQNEVLFNLIN